MDWKSIVGPVLHSAAPMLAKGLLGQIPVIGPIAVAMGGQAIDSAIGNLIATTLGVEPTPEAVGKAIQEMPTDVVMRKLEAAESEAATKWPALVEMYKADQEGRTARFEAGVKDNADARDLQARLVNTGSPIQWAPTLVSVIVLFGYFAVLYLLFTRPFAKLDDNFKDILIFMLGALQVGVGQVINYWLGSSAGSAAKDAAMRDITATSVVAASTSIPTTAVPKGVVKR